MYLYVRKNGWIYEGVYMIDDDDDGVSGGGDGDDFIWL